MMDGASLILGLALLLGVTTFIVTIVGGVDVVVGRICEAVAALIEELTGEVGLESEPGFRLLVMLPVGILLAMLFAAMAGMIIGHPGVLLGAIVIVVGALIAAVLADPDKGGGPGDGPKLPLNF